MDTLPLLAALFVVPGACLAEPMDLGFDVTGLVVDDVVGKGRVLGEGDLATFHYEIVDANGKVLADSERRGLPYTASSSSEGTEGAILGVLIGARVGGERRLITDSDAVGIGGDSLIPRRAAIEIHVRLLGVGASADAKVK